MRWARIFLSGFALMMYSALLCAQAPFLCANTYRYIQVGMTLDQVRAACGEPTSASEKRGSDIQQEDVEEWVYNLDYPRLGEGPRQMLQLVIQDGKVASMSMAGSAWTSNQGCRGNPIKIGDNAANIQSLCGAPTFINRGKQNVNRGVIKYTTWTYDFGPYKPKATLVFKSGILSSINGE